MTRSALLVACALALAPSIVPAVALADAKSEAQERVAHAQQLYQDKQYKEALDELNIAYTLDPQPNVLYAIGQIHVALGDCKEAITFYTRFLQTKPDQDVAAAAQQAIEACKSHRVPPPDGGSGGSGGSGAEGSGQGSAEGSATSGSAMSGSAGGAGSGDAGSGSAAPTAPSGPHWYDDHVADALVGGGVVAAVVAVVLYADARGDISDAQAATSYPSQQSLVDSASSLRTGSLIVTALAAGLVAGGVIHYSMHHKEQAIAVAPTARGGAVTWTVRF
jgi:tetratricopeptide (TPR) repeat protein